MRSASINYCSKQIEFLPYSFTSNINAEQETDANIFEEMATKANLSSNAFKRKNIKYV